MLLDLSSYPKKARELIGCELLPKNKLVRRDPKPEMLPKLKRATAMTQQRFSRYIFLVAQHWFRHLVRKNQSFCLERDVSGDALKFIRSAIHKSSCRSRQRCRGPRISLIKLNMNTSFAAKGPYSSSPSHSTYYSAHPSKCLLHPQL